MSDYIPFEIQIEIIKWLPVKPLIRFRSVSKPWKSFIDSSEFIKGYGARNTQPHSRILSYKSHHYMDEPKYICLVEDDKNETLQQELAPFVVSSLLKQYRASFVVGVCRGLLCLFCCDKLSDKKMVVIWNPSIGKSFGIVAPIDYSRYHRPIPTVYGFGVCPITRDPTVVKIKHMIGMPWHVEVFTLSSGVWNVIPSGNLPRKSIELDSTPQVVIDRLIYWGAHESTFTDDGLSTINHMVVSFDLITKEFKVVDFRDSLSNELYGNVSVSKLGESLVVYGSIYVKYIAGCRGVWVMEPDSSFRKLFTICAPVKIWGFTKSSEPICETLSVFRHNAITYENLLFNTLDVYDPCSQHVKSLGISGFGNSFFMDSYKESLLLFDHCDSHIYSDVN